ncbi:MAG: DNA-3-methyladenine glycosylase 2 family protein [Chlorobiaceae bacterium]|nr:DNA-3-methyladenine glycosylase 2 family protein [Chlorobiaceae bacterium]MBA4309215.1 DNA-3-methyladenine glycosylase 2 family protein [Chlorobiaceae bacterium]
MNSKQIRNGIEHLKKNDDVLMKIISNFKQIKLEKHSDIFSDILKSIVQQQLSVAAAGAIYEKVKTFFENNLSPEKILSTTHEELRSLGLSNAKAKYIKDLAEKTLSKEISFDDLEKKTDDEIISELTKVKGVGVWTAQMILIFSLARLDVLPVGDFGIKKAVMMNYNLKELPDEKRVEKISKKNNWAPYNSIASIYLWKSLGSKE